MIKRCRDCIHFNAPGICRCRCGERRVVISELCVCDHFRICEGQQR